jgi:hypothetical protein
MPRQTLTEKTYREYAEGGGSSGGAVVGGTLEVTNAAVTTTFATGTNISSRTITAPAAGTVRYILGAAVYMTGTNNAPYDAWIEVGDRALVGNTGLVNDERMTCGPFVQVSGENIVARTTAAIGAGTSMFLYVSYIEVPEGQLRIMPNIGSQ